MPCIYYPIQFKKDKKVIRVLRKSGNEVNTITPTYAAKLDLTALKTNVRAQNIDGFPLGTYEMVFASSQVEDNQGRARFF